jgi:DNA-binding NtrC family response regulator
MSRGLDMKMHTVLIVEDEVLIRELVAEEFEEAGYIVVIANDADQAIAIRSPSGYQSRFYRYRHARFHGRAETSPRDKRQVASGSHHHHHR